MAWTFLSHEEYRRTVVGHLISKRLDIGTMPRECDAETVIGMGFKYKVGAYDCACQLEDNLYAHHERALADRKA